MVLWGGWLVTLGATFWAVTTINAYYTAAVASAVAAIIGTGIAAAWTPKARVHATAVGGPWEWRMRPSGAVAVVVPLGWQVIFQPQRWMTMMW